MWSLGWDRQKKRIVYEDVPQEDVNEDVSEDAMAKVIKADNVIEYVIEDSTKEVLSKMRCDWWRLMFSKT